MKLYGMPLFYAEIKRKEIYMCDSKGLHLKFVGMDSWDRPVYKDDSGTCGKMWIREQE